MDRLVAHGYVDTFRHFHPDLAGLMPRMVDAFILPDVRGSDHCPVGIRLTVAASY